MAENEEIIAEARRKALRNGEEDPVVVAQRYLNIYRQMHIFSPERKEAFNKMLLELPPEISSIFSALPGGLMLQDYLSDLAEKNGVVRASPKKDEETTDIPPPVQPTVQPSVSVPPSQVQFVPQSNLDVSLGKDFAQQLAGAFNDLLVKQSELQRDGLEKISAGLSKNQIALAQYINQNKESQQQNFKELLEVLAQKSTASIPVATEIKTDDSVLKEIINNQKEISLRLTKMESTALSGSGNNQEMIDALVKTNAEMLSSFQANTAVNKSTVDTQELLKLIEQTQAQLIEGVVGRILQNNVLNNTQTSASNNNANNIQINTPDTSAQTLMLVNKITDLQTANEKNMEEAITRLIKAQKEIYENISSSQSKEIAQAIVDGLKSASLTFNNYAPTPAYVVPETVPSEVMPDLPPSKEDEVSEIIYGTRPVDTQTAPQEETSFFPTDDPTIDNIKKKKKKKKKKNKDMTLVTAKEGWHIANEEAPEVTDDNFFNPEEEFTPSPLPQEPVNIADTWDNVDDSLEEAPQIAQSFSFKNEDAPLETRSEQESQSLDSDVRLDENKGDEFTDISNEIYSGVVADDKASWGFDEEAKEEGELDNKQLLNNDEENLPAYNDENYEEVEMIGAQSNIYIDDLSRQTVGETLNPIIYNKLNINLGILPQIFDDVDDDKDPYIK